MLLTSEYLLSLFSNFSLTWSLASCNDHKPSKAYDTVLQFSYSSLAWTEVWRMEQPRAHHATSLVSFQMLAKFLQNAC